VNKTILKPRVAAATVYQHIQFVSMLQLPTPSPLVALLDAENITVG